MKTLLINGSPRPNGNTVALIRELKAHLEGELVEISRCSGAIWLESSQASLMVFVTITAP